MRWTLLVTCSLLLAPMAGCMDTGDDGEEPSYAVAWEDRPGDRKTGEPVEMTWSVDGPEGEIPHTGIHYADSSVEDPQSPADYSNTSGAQEPAQIPGTFDTEVTFDEAGTYYIRAHAVVGDDEQLWSEEVEIEISESGPVETGIDVTMTSHDENATTNDTVAFEWELSGVPSEADETSLRWGPNGTDEPTPTAYAKEAGTVENASVPGTYNASLADLEPGTYHARAHALHDGSHYWSDEVRFNVTEPAEELPREDHTVEITGIVTGFDPEEITVTRGDNITWENTDSNTHTVTFDNGTLGDSGDIEAGDTYELPIPDDLEPGSYDYVCTYHESTMTGTVHVEDP